jgi:hypothetical protein
LKYSPSTAAVGAPVMSRVHRRSVRASFTEHLCRFLATA